MKIATANEVVPSPVWDWDAPRKQNEKRQKEYINKVVNHAKQNGAGEHKGKILYFSVGDGLASYVVFDSKTLIHLEHADAYRLPLDHRMTIQDALLLGTPLSA